MIGTAGTGESGAQSSPALRRRRHGCDRCGYPAVLVLALAWSAPSPADITWSGATPHRGGGDMRSERQPPPHGGTRAGEATGRFGAGATGAVPFSQQRSRGDGRSAGDERAGHGLPGAPGYGTGPYHPGPGGYNPYVPRPGPYGYPYGLLPGLGANPYGHGYGDYDGARSGYPLNPYRDDRAPGYSGGMPGYTSPTVPRLVPRHGRPE